jgi:hypothetical protein
MADLDTILANCPANNLVGGTTPPDPGLPVSDKWTISPGISSQTPPPTPVPPASGQSVVLSPDQLEDNAKSAVSTFVTEGHKPARDKGRVSALKNAAICAAAANLKRQEQVANNAEKVKFATRLLRQALETKQGVAETGKDLVKQKIAELFRMEQRLADQWNHQPNKPLTAEEKLEVSSLISKAKVAAIRNVDEWKEALLANFGSNSERYGDLEICVLEYFVDDETLLATLDLIERIAAKAETYVELLDGAARRRATNNR